MLSSIYFTCDNVADFPISGHKYRHMHTSVCRHRQIDRHTRYKNSGWKVEQGWIFGHSFTIF